MAVSPSIAFAADDWSLERNQKDPTLIQQRFAKLRQHPFATKEWRALESTIGRSALLQKIELTWKNNQDDPNLTILYARSLLLGQQSKRAAELLSGLQTRSTRLQTAIFDLRMEALEAAGEHQTVISELEQRAQQVTNPKLQRTLQTRAQTYAQSHNLPKEAVRIAKLMASQEPQRADLQLALARSALDTNDRQVANAAYEAAIRASASKQQIPLKMEWIKARVQMGDVQAGVEQAWQFLTSANNLESGQQEELWTLLVDGHHRSGSDEVFLQQLSSWLSQSQNSQNTAAWRALANVQEHLGRDPSSTLRKILAIQPHDHESRKQLIYALDRRDESAAAVTEFEQFPIRSTERAEVGFELANRLITTGKREEALRIVNHLLAGTKNDLQIYLLALDFYNLNDEQNLALKTAERLVELHPRNPEARIVLGEQLYQMHREAEALEQWAMVPKLTHPQHSGWARHAELLLEHQQPDAAKSLERALRLSANNPEYLRLSAILATEQQSSPEALQAWIKLLEHAKGETHRLLREEARMRIVELLAEHTASPLRQATEQEALNAFMRKGQSAGEMLEAGLFLAELYTREQNYQKAVEVYQKLTELQPGNPQRMADLALSQRRAGHVQEALETVERLLENDPHRGMEVLAELLETAFEIGNIQQLLQVVQTAEDKGMDGSQVRVQLGELYARRGQVQEAEKIYYTILQAKPEDAAVRLALADLYLNQGKAEQATVLFWKILESGGPPEIIHRASQQILNLFEAKKNMVHVLEFALRNITAPSYVDAQLDFLLSALERTPTEQIQAWTHTNALRTALLQALNRGSMGVRLRAAEQLGQLALPETALPLVRIGAQLSPPKNATPAIKNAYQRTRVTAIKAAGKLNDPSIIPTLAELLQPGLRFAEVRYAAAWALVQTDDPQAAHHLRPYVQTTEDSLLTAFACIAFAKVGPPASSIDRRLVERMSQRAHNPTARTLCTFALAAMTPDAEMEPLISQLHTSNQLDAAIAAWRLSRNPANAHNSKVMEALFVRYLGIRGLARDASGSALATLLNKTNRSAEIPSLPYVELATWQFICERWLKSVVAPSFEQIPSETLKPVQNELLSAFDKVSKGTRAEREALMIEKDCLNPPSKLPDHIYICLSPLVESTLTIQASE